MVVLQRYSIEGGLRFLHTGGDCVENEDPGQNFV